MPDILCEPNSPEPDPAGVILLDAYGRPYQDGVMAAPHPVVPPMPEDVQRRRSSKWPKFLHDFLKSHPLCIGCGRKAETGHHVKPFHLFPEDELDPNNIVAVDVPCHFVLCHAEDWRLTVENVRDRLYRNLTDMAKVWR